MDAYLLWAFALRQIAGHQPRTLTEDEFYAHSGWSKGRISIQIQRMIRTIVS
ncbi:hypothetical protein [Phyllobacterium brassicacearum]|uniref:hypothetical protein n=1 Tax=Phyllobacterium brassicacearum TaxID=314235 RepID=UPI0010D6EFEC|nr:hypothetical protein [Phyllobacterium brassicacearum]TDQ35611.1 hypothetical protein DEV91_10193 [Phyllobacterium brassicacearum]